MASKQLLSEPFLSDCQSFQSSSSGGSSTQQPPGINSVSSPVLSPITRKISGDIDVDDIQGDDLETGDLPSQPPSQPHADAGAAVDDLRDIGYSPTETVYSPDNDGLAGHRHEDATLTPSCIRGWEEFKKLNGLADLSFVHFVLLLTSHSLNVSKLVWISSWPSITDPATTKIQFIEKVQEPVVGILVVSAMFFGVVAFDTHSFIKVKERSGDFVPANCALESATRVFEHLSRVAPLLHICAFAWHLRSTNAPPPPLAHLLSEVLTKSERDRQSLERGVLLVCVALPFVETLLGALVTACRIKTLCCRSIASLESEMRTCVRHSNLPRVLEEFFENFDHFWGCKSVGFPYSCTLAVFAFTPSTSAVCLAVWYVEHKNMHWYDGHIIGHWANIATGVLMLPLTLWQILKVTQALKHMIPTLRRGLWFPAWSLSRRSGTAAVRLLGVVEVNAKLLLWTAVRIYLYAPSLWMYGTTLMANQHSG
jgi:hypothetical protein